MNALNFKRKIIWSTTNKAKITPQINTNRGEMLSCVFLRNIKKIKSKLKKTRVMY